MSEFVLWILSKIKSTTALWGWVWRMSPMVTSLSVVSTTCEAQTRPLECVEVFWGCLGVVYEP